MVFHVHFSVKLIILLHWTWNFSLAALEMARLFLLSIELISCHSLDSFETISVAASIRLPSATIPILSSQFNSVRILIVCVFEFSGEIVANSIPFSHSMPMPMPMPKKHTYHQSMDDRS